MSLRLSTNRDRNAPTARQAGAPPLQAQRTG